MSILVFQHISFAEMTLFLFLCILRYLPQEKNPRGLCQREILLFCSFLHCNEKRIVYVQVPVLVGSP